MGYQDLQQRQDRRLVDYKPELEFAGQEAESIDGKVAGHYGEMSFAARLLEAQSPAELVAVLAELVAQAPGARDAGKAPLRAPMIGVLQRAARMVFPVNATQAPGDLKRKAAAIFGLELEGLSPEDKEFEVARHFVRLAGDAAEEAFDRPAHDADRSVRQALLAASRRHAPGLLRQRARTAPAMIASGRWQRRGNRIVILDG